MPGSPRRTIVAWTLYDYAKALLDTGGPDDRERAAILLHEGHDLSSQPSMVQYPPGCEMSQLRVSSSSLQSNCVRHSSPIFLPQAARPGTTDTIER